MEWVLIGGAVAIVALIAWQVRAARGAAGVEAEGKKAYERTLARGAQPPSLHPRIDLDACIGSGVCVQVCPEVNVLAVIDGKARVVNPTSCIGHGECLRGCPTDAIRLVLGTEQRGVDIPLLSADYQTNVPGLFIVGELGGMGLIYNATSQALSCLRAIAKDPPARAEGVHQLAIVGAGPAGLAASLAALEAKLDFVTLDQESIGGTVLQYPRHKIVMTRPVELPLYGPLNMREVPKEALLEVWKDVLTKTGLTVRTGVKVASVQRADDGVFDVATSAGPLRAQRVVLAIGRRGSPRKLGVPGEDLGKVTYRLLEPENYAAGRCLVVGGGDAAIESALALAEAGAATVHLAHRREVFDRIKPKNQERLDAAIAKGAVTLLLSSQTREIRPDAVLLDVKGASIELPNDYVLVFAGGELPAAFLEKAGVEVKTFKGEEYAPANV